MFDFKNIKSIVGNRHKRPYRILRWDMVDYCNHTCPYCIKYTSDKTSYVKDWGYHVNWLNEHLIDTNFIIQFFGGEPTLHPQIFQICDKLLIPFGVYTNLSKPLSFWENILSYERYTYFICSYHASQVYDDKKFFNILKYFNDNYSHINLNVAVMIENTNIKRTENMLIKLRSELSNITTYLNNVTNDSEYYNGFNLAYYNKYMLPEQFVHMVDDSGNMILISEIDILLASQNCTDINFLNINKCLCDINTYGNFILTSAGDLYTCVRNTPVHNIYCKNFNTNVFNRGKVICRNNKCLPYLMEYGTKIQKFSK